MSAEAVRAARLRWLADEAGRRSWLLLTVHPGETLAVAARLGRRGLAAYAPARTVWRQGAAGGRKRRLAVAALPGYALLGELPGECALTAALRVAGVSGVLGRDGEPARIGAEAVTWIAQQSSEAPEVEQWMRQRREYALGAVVEVAGLGDARGVVVGLSARHAMVLTRILGAERAVRCGLGDLALAS